MQNPVIDITQVAESELPANNVVDGNDNYPVKLTNANQYAEALSDIAVQLHQLDAAFAELDNLKAQERESVAALEEAGREEQTILENQDTSEKQAVDKLLKARALKDIRSTRVAGIRKRLTLHVDLVVHDIGSDVRRACSNLAHGLLAARRERFLALFNELIPVPSEHGLPFNNDILVRICRPVAELQNFVNTVNRESRPSIEEELAELRSEVPRRWLSELRVIVAQEQSI
jgi:hypothetical protein